MKILLAAAAVALAVPVAMADVVIRYEGGQRIHTHQVTVGPIVTQADAERAYHALRRTANRTCAHHGTTTRVGQKHAEARACRADALRAAVESLDNDRVTAIYRQGL